jgi:ketosteroid isomerase-like protein
MSNSIIEQLINATNRVFEGIVANRNFAALDQVYTADARVMPPGAETVQGIDNIRAFWAQAIDSLGVQSILLQTISLQTAGDFVFEIGRAQLHTGVGDPVPAKFVVIWKQENGVWKWNVDIWNTVS